MLFKIIKGSINQMPTWLHLQDPFTAQTCQYLLPEPTPTNISFFLRQSTAGTTTSNNLSYQNAMKC